MVIGLSQIKGGGVGGQSLDRTSVTLVPQLSHLITCSDYQITLAPFPFQIIFPLTLAIIVTNTQANSVKLGAYMSHIYHHLRHFIPHIQQL